MFSLFLLSRANLFPSNDSINDPPKAICSFINIARSLARNLARYILIKSFAMFVINEIDRDKSLSVSLVEAGSYYRAKS